MSAPKLYLSSPERLHKNGAAWYAEAAELAARYGFELLPLPEAAFCPTSSREEGAALAKQRCELIAQCDLLIADTRDFRNELEPHAEAGYELGYAFGLEKKLYNVPESIDDEIGRVKLRSMGINIDTLTKAQKAYLGIE